MATLNGDTARLARQFAPVADRIARLVTAPALRRMANDMNSVQKQWTVFQQLTLNINWEQVEDWFETGLPPNWADVEPRLEVVQVLEFMRETRWCLVWVPRGQIVRRLVEANEDDRGDVLLGSAPQILEDCRSVLDVVEHPELQQVRRAASQVATAIAAELDLAAQALVASCLSDVINTKFHYSFKTAQERFRVDDPMKISWMRFRESAVFLLVAEALENYWHEKGDPVPARFSRHASAHSVSEDQYNRENALAGLLLLTAFLMECELLTKEHPSGDDAA